MKLNVPEDRVTERREYNIIDWTVGIRQHFYEHLNALKPARIKSRENPKTHSVAKIGKIGNFSAFLGAL